MKLKVNKVIVKGFKGYETEKEFFLGTKTLISGENGQGKSSIGEAIAWAITGCDIFGNEKAASRLVNDNKPKVTEVVLEFTLDGGEPQTLIRRKKGSTNEIYWNEDKITNNDLAKEIYKSKDVFLSIFNPYYFPALSPKDSKQLLSGILKPISKEDIYTELGDFLKSKLENNGFRIPETFLADKRADLKEHEENIVFLEGKLSVLKPLDVEEKLSFDYSELNSLKEQLSTFNKVEDTDSQITQLNIEENMISHELNSIVLEPIIPVQDKVLEKEMLLERYKQLKQKLDGMEKNLVLCPECGYEIDLTKEHKELIQKELEEILPQGKKLAVEIANLNIKNGEIQKRNLTIKTKLEDNAKEKLEAIEKKRKKILGQNEESKAKTFTRLNEIKEKILDLEGKEREVLLHNAKVDNAIKQNEDIEKQIETINKQIGNSKLKIAELKMAIDAGKQYNSIKLKKQSKAIGEYLDKVTLQFEKLTKDGEIKDDFQILYEGREFNKLSNAEKIKAGLEVSNFISNMLNLHFPIFIDNSESITKIKDLDTQIIMAQVVKGSELKVEVVK